ncbi:MAG: Hpt domain-containing protein [Planctomycetota bacterium]
MAQADSQQEPSQILDQAMVAQLRDLADGSDALLIEVLQTFTADSPQRIVDMRAALAAGDADALHRGAHTLKGACGNLGLRRLEWACAQLDRQARSGDLEPCAQLLAAVEVAYAEGVGALEAETG